MCMHLVYYPPGCACKRSHASVTWQICQRHWPRSYCVLQASCSSQPTTHRWLHVTDDHHRRQRSGGRLQHTEWRRRFLEKICHVFGQTVRGLFRTGSDWLCKCSENKYICILSCCPRPDGDVVLVWWHWRVAGTRRGGACHLAVSSCSFLHFHAITGDTSRELNYRNQVLPSITPMSYT